jgi:hypothetical protein
MLAYIPAPWIRHGYKYHILHLGPTFCITWTRRDPIGGRVTTRHLRKLHSGDEERWLDLPQLRWSGLREVGTGATTSVGMEQVLILDENLKMGERPSIPIKDIFICDFQWGQWWVSMIISESHLELFIVFHRFSTKPYLPYPEFGLRKEWLIGR